MKTCRTLKALAIVFTCITCAAEKKKTPPSQVA